MNRHDFIYKRDLPPGYSIHDWFYLLCYESVRSQEPRQIVGSLFMDEELYLHIAIPRKNSNSLPPAFVWTKAHQSFFHKDRMRFHRVWRQKFMVMRANQFKAPKYRYLEDDPDNKLSLAG